MDVAIRTATVISSVLTALCGADLIFFNGEPVKPPVIPRTIKQVLDVASGVKADGLTAAAAGLWPYYTQKKVVKFFIVVTDEIDNEKYKGHYFPTLFQKYYNEVYPSKIVLVSFLENPSEKGRIVKSLEAMGIVPLQFKLDGKRPDLTKLDSLLGLLASESSFFSKKADAVVLDLKEKGLNKAWKDLEEPEIATTTTTTTSTKDEEEAVVIPEEVKEAPKEVQKKEKKSKEEEEKCCVICEERPVEVALLECGHMSFCQKCAEPLKECPICRQKVLRFIRIYQN